MIYTIIISLLIKKPFSLLRPQSFLFDTNSVRVYLGGGGGGVSESMDGRECIILALELVPKNLIFA